MPTDGVGPEMDLSMVARGWQVTVVRGASRSRAPTVQEPLCDNAKSTTCARQLTFARGESQRVSRPPTHLESLREKAGIATSAEPQDAARAGGPAMGGLARDMERLSELEPSVKCEVPDDCDVELNAFLGALTVDQQESLNSLYTRKYCRSLMLWALWAVVVKSMLESVIAQCDVWSRRSTRRHESLLLPRCCLPRLSVTLCGGAGGPVCSGTRWSHPLGGRTDL